MTKLSDRPGWLYAVIDVVMFALCIGIVIWVLMRPAIVLAPTPRIVVLFALSMLPAVVLASRATARLKLEAKGVMFTAAGATAVVFASLWALVHFSRPDTQVAVYHVVGEDGQAATWIDQGNAVTVQASKRGAAPTAYVDGNTIVLVFPEQIETAFLTVKDPIAGKAYAREVSYTEEQPTLRVGVDLKEVH